MSEKSETVDIKGFPRDLMMQIRSEVPLASNNTEALVAYVCALQKNWDGRSERVQQLARLVRIFE